MSSDSNKKKLEERMCVFELINRKEYESLLDAKRGKTNDKSYGNKIVGNRLPAGRGIILTEVKS